MMYLSSSSSIIITLFLFFLAWSHGFSPIIRQLFYCTSDKKIVSSALQQSSHVSQASSSSTIIGERRGVVVVREQSSSLLLLYARRLQDETISKEEKKRNENSSQNNAVSGTKNNAATAAATTTTKRRTWDESYELLSEYYKEHRDSNVPNKYKKDPKLGKWVETQRNRKNRLSADKIAKLDVLDFIWDGVVAKKIWADKKWEEMFQELVQYKKENGNCNVSQLEEAHKELAYWVQRQRSSRTNDVPSMTAYRIQKLDSIGFVWRQRSFSRRQSDRLDRKWDEKYEELALYKKENGHCNVPRFYEPNKPLGEWVVTQRSMNAGTHHAGAVRPDRKKRLDELGFDWGFEEVWDDAWLSMYNQLKELQKYCEENNLDRQTWSSQADQKLLWAWEIAQQNLYTRDKLDPQREALLEEICYWKSIGLKRSENQVNDANIIFGKIDT